MSWVQGEKRSRVQSSVIMECFNSLRCLYANLSLPFHLSFPLPHCPPPISLPSQTCSGWNVRLSHRPARCLSSQPSILFSPSLRALCCAEILIRFFFFSSPDSALIPPQDLLINVLPATVTTAGTDTGIGPCTPAQTHASADTQSLPSF